REPALPEAAEDGVPGADPSGDRGPAGAGPAARATGPRAGRDDQNPTQGQGGMTRYRCYIVEFLGEFRILGEIGRGGMGMVFKAEQTSLQRLVAVKILPGSDQRSLE